MGQNDILFIILIWILIGGAIRINSKINKSKNKPSKFLTIGWFILGSCTIGFVFGLLFSFILGYLVANTVERAVNFVLIGIGVVGLTWEFILERKFIK